jgi:hypothetical protein
MKDITVFLTEQFEAAASVNEGKVSSEKDFREFAEKMAKEAFGDKFDEDKFKETVDKFLDDNKDLVDDDKWAEVVGMWEQGFTKED